ncbi:MAG TPA: ArgE/DapE family deacylase [Devosiaceae bacterium]|jgi:acetylornithine deacetylase
MPTDSSPVLRDRLQPIIAANWPAQIEWLRELARFPSLRGNEGPCQDWLAGEFAKRDWSVDRFTLDEVQIAALPGYSPAVEVDYSKAVQVVATVPSGERRGRSLILQGHIDVVPTGPRELWAHEPFEPQVEGNHMSGRGVGDMKVGVAEIVFALDALRQAGLRPTAEIFVETVSEEEVTGNGALATLARGYLADACLIPEAMGNQLLRAQLGSIWFRLRLVGRSAHILETQLGTSAILGMYDYITAMQALAARSSATAADSEWFAHLDSPVKFSVGKIKGGDWIGMVPNWCEVDCRIGILPGQDLTEMRQSILDTIADCARRQGNAAPPEVSWIGFQADAYVLEPGSDAEAALAAAHETVFGEKLETFSLPATSDVRQYGVYYGIPALCYGSKSSGSHSSDERADLVSMRDTTLTLALFIANWCGVEAIP